MKQYRVVEIENIAVDDMLSALSIEGWNIVSHSTYWKKVAVRARCFSTILFYSIILEKEIG